MGNVDCMEWEVKGSGLLAFIRSKNEEVKKRIDMSCFHWCAKVY